MPIHLLVKAVLENLGLNLAQFEVFYIYTTVRSSKKNLRYLKL